MQAAKQTPQSEDNAKSRRGNKPFFSANSIQAKLQVNTPGDSYEREADAMAEHVMRMSNTSVSRPSFFGSSDSVQRKCQHCEDEEKKVHRKENSDAETQADNSLDNYVNSLGSSGRSLSEGERSFFEPRFDYDFSGVKIHTDEAAAQSAQSINALAYTTGNNIVFNSGQFSPETESGKKLMAHELTHVVQQNSGVKTAAIQKYPSCTGAQDTTIAADHAMALQMLRNAISKISSYDGTNPPEVHSALAKHFSGSTSNAFATWINFNLRDLLGAMDDKYECFTGGVVESRWACRSPRELATTFWCVPGFSIRICPLYFTESAIERATTLIHEWVHKYGCNFDLGYSHETGYGGNSTLTQLLNADSFANLVKDVQ